MAGPHGGPVDRVRAYYRTSWIGYRCDPPELTQFDRAEGAGHVAVQAHELVWAATGSLKVDGGLVGGLTRHSRPEGLTCRLDLLEDA
jgi:hypothetical protein